MKSYAAQDHFVIVLDKGELLHDRLTSFLRSQHIEAAWIQGLGAALEVTLGFYNLETKQYQWKDFTGPFELTSLQGNAVSDADGPVLHMHATLSDAQYQAFGGHVQRLVVGGTCELLVRPLSAKLTRQLDDTTGLNLVASLNVPPHRTI